jgi:hypothetical protein
MKTLEELNKSVERLEKQMVKIQQEVDLLQGGKTEKRASRLEERQSRVRSENQQVRPILEHIVQEMGIEGQPIGAKQVQHLVEEDGVSSEENLFSRDIISTREASQ